jgi:hypothetical protein
MASFDFTRYQELCISFPHSVDEIRQSTATFVGTLSEQAQQDLAHQALKDFLLRCRNELKAAKLLDQTWKWLKRVNDGDSRLADTVATIGSIGPSSWPFQDMFDRARELRMAWRESVGECQTLRDRLDTACDHIDDLEARLTTAPSTLRLASQDEITNGLRRVRGILDLQEPQPENVRQRLHPSGGARLRQRATSSSVHDSRAGKSTEHRIALEIHCSPFIRGRYAFPTNASGSIDARDKFRCV